MKAKDIVVGQKYVYEEELFCSRDRKHRRVRYVPLTYLGSMNIPTSLKTKRSVHWIEFDNNPELGSYLTDDKLKYIYPPKSSALKGKKIFFWKKEAARLLALSDDKLKTLLKKGWTSDMMDAWRLSPELKKRAAKLFPKSEIK